MFHFNSMAGNACFRGGGGGNSWIRVGWKPPSMGIFKLNTDGASKGNPGKAGAGGLIRNHEGRWVAGFCHNIGTTNSLEAEVTAIRDGLELVNRLGLTNVDVETDSKLAVQLIAGSIFSGERVNSLVNDCRRLMEEIGSTTLRHVYREANACADILANLGVVADGLEVFANAPSCVAHQLYNDAIGVEYSRQMKQHEDVGVRGGVMRQRLEHIATVF
ncbi:Ribonuclease H protein [Actinidia chinensis var. chinensis]|uniref:Ribonuclease H protein n=1 Tax=Actinidia chinensis var. chinensis TaxID=1590841 RepID=A0A2R6RWH6_ACTCC|nr:Ribonuclease H protein [Actinidia chinensis var. chinensis]